MCCIGLIGAYSNYTDKSAIPSHWHLVVTRQQLLPRCEVLCAHGLSGQCSVAQVVLRQVACKQVMEVEGKEEREGKRREYGVEYVHHSSVTYPEPCHSSAISTTFMQCIHSVCAACVTCLALLPSEPLWAVTYHQIHTLSARPTVLTNIDLTGLEVLGDQLSLCVNEQCI